MNYNVFDTLLDAVVVMDQDKRIVYANEIFGQMCNTPVFRLIKSKTVFDSVISFDPAPFDLSASLKDYTAATPYLEVAYKSGGDRQGKVAVTLQPFPPENMAQGTQLWVVYMRDVLLEETLQKKYKAELGQKEEVITELKAAKEKLQDYSKNLEKMVAERTAQLAASNQMLNAMVNSLGQGFLVFNADGRCLDVYSRACLPLLEIDPKHKTIWEVLRVPENKQEDFKKWCKFLFAEAIPYEDLIGAAPKTIAHSKFLHIALEYYPIRDEQGKITEICLVATDKTSELEAQKQAKKEKALAERVLKLTKNKTQFWRFVNESMNNMGQIKHNLNPKKAPDINTIFRLIHTLKGDAGAFRVTSVVEVAHAFETELDRFRTIPDNDKIQKIPYIKTEIEKIEKTMEVFLKGNKDIIGDFRGASGKKLEVAYQDLVFFHKEMEKEKVSPRLTTVFEDGFLKEPVSGFVFQYNDLMEDMATRTRKSIKPLALVGGDLKIHEGPHSALFSSFIHIIRNSVDHGLETPKERVERGKDSEGEIKIAFSKFQNNGQNWMKIVFQDDGRGIDPQKIREKMASKGVDVTKEDDKQVIQHVFDTGFSTASAVTEFSGRGMGMDAVKSEVEKLGGRCLVESDLGEGTRVIVEFPETTLSGQNQKQKLSA